MLNESDFNKKLGQKIKDCRLAAGYSQSNVAQVLGFESATAVSLIESGDRSLNIRSLIALTELFRKDYAYFLNHGLSNEGKKKSGPHEDVEELARRLLKMVKNEKGK